MAVLLLAAHAAGLGLLPAADPRWPAAAAPGVRRPTPPSASGSATCSARSRSPSSAPTRSARTPSRTAPQRADRRESIDRAPHGRDPGPGAGGRVASAAASWSRASSVAVGGGRRHAGRRRRRPHASASCSPSSSSSSSSRSRCRWRTEVLNELQNAVAGWRRVIAVLDTPADVADPGEAGVDAAARADHGRGSRTSASPTPAARRCCTTSTCAIPRAGPGRRSSARPARARRRWPSCSPG